MITAFFSLIVGDALLYVVLRLIRSLPWRSGDGEVPVQLSCVLAMLTFTAHTWLSVNLFGHEVLDSQLPIVVGTFFLSGLAPVVVAVQMMVASIAQANVETIYGLRRVAVALGTDYSLARTKRAKNDIPGAILEYRRYHLEEEHNPHALFEAATLLESEGLPMDAADVYRGILAKFPTDNATWSEAAYRLANIHENEMHDRAAAIRLLVGVVQRTPTSETGRLAGARLMTRYAISA